MLRVLHRPANFSRRVSFWVQFKKMVEHAQDRFLQAVQPRYPTLPAFVKAFDHTHGGRITLDDWQRISRRALRDGHSDFDAFAVFQQIKPAHRDYIVYKDLNRLYYEVPLRLTVPDTVKPAARRQSQVPNPVVENLKRDLVHFILQKLHSNNCTESNNKALLQAFQTMDTSGDGELSYSEMSAGFGPKLLNLPWSEKQQMAVCRVRVMFWVCVCVCVCVCVWPFYRPAD